MIGSLPIARETAECARLWAHKEFEGKRERFNLDIAISAGIYIALDWDRYHILFSIVHLTVDAGGSASENCGGLRVQNGD